MVQEVSNTQHSLTHTKCIRLIECVCLHLDGYHPMLIVPNEHSTYTEHTHTHTRTHVHICTHALGKPCSMCVHPPAVFYLVCVTHTHSHTGMHNISCKVAACTCTHTHSQKHTLTRSRIPRLQTHRNVPNTHTHVFA